MTWHLSAEKSWIVYDKNGAGSQEAKKYTKKNGETILVNSEKLCKMSKNTFVIRCYCNIFD